VASYNLFDADLGSVV